LIIYEKFNSGGWFMTSKVMSIDLKGLEGYPVGVEVRISQDTEFSRRGTNNGWSSLGRDDVKEKVRY
jgi:hypothetical protein